MMKFFTRRNILLILSGLVLIFLLYYFRNIVGYIILAAILSLVLQPIVATLSKIKIGKKYFPKSLAAAIALMVFGLFIFIILRLLVPLIIHEAQLISSIQTGTIINEFQSQFSLFLQEFKDLNLPIDNSTTIAGDIFKNLLDLFNLTSFQDILSNITGTISSLLVGTFVVTFITFFFLKDERLFFSSVLLLVPTDLETEVKHIFLSIKYLLIRYFVGIIADMIIIFALVSLGMTLIGLEMRHAATLGLFAAILNVIPYVGPILSLTFGLTLGTLIHLDMPIYESLSIMLIWMLVIYLTVNVLDAFLIQPFIFSKSVKAHPLEIFLVILIAGTVAGITGMILAIPIYSIIRVVAREFLSGFKLVRKLTEKM